MTGTGTAARIQVAEQRLAQRAGVFVDQFSVRLPRTGGMVRVLAAGEGQPYLLLHGAALSAAWWIPLMPHLAGRLIAVDLPGHGLSDDYDVRSVDPRTLAVELVTTVLDVERLEQAALVGHALGAATAVWTALDAPERVCRIVLVGDPGVGQPPDLHPLLPLPAATPGGSVPTAGRRPVADYAAALARVLHEPALRRMPALAEVAYHAAGRRAARSSERPPTAAGPMIGLGDLSTVEGWVRWLWGRDDPFGRAGAARAAVAGMPRAHFQLVAGGHIPWLGDPGNVGALIAADAPPIRSLRTTLVER